MKANKLNYLKMVKDIERLVASDFCLDMEMTDEYTQDEAKKMVKIIGQVYMKSHLWFCTACNSTKYKLKG